MTRDAAIAALVAWPNAEPAEDLLAIARGGNGALSARSTNVARSRNTFFSDASER